MATLTAPNPGQAMVAFVKAMRYAQQRYNEMQNCRTCDKQLAEQWKRDAELFAHFIHQLENQ